MSEILDYIGGSFRPGVAGSGTPSINPSDRDDVVGIVPDGSPEDVADAVAAASGALDAWRFLTGSARAEHLHRWAAAIDARKDELARALMREVGKPIGEAMGEIGRCIVILRYYAGEAVRTVGDVVPAQAASTLQFSLREPLGVVGLITPWNFPAAIPLWKAAPALAFGNTVVLKPAEQASHVAMLLAETAHAAGLPHGVLNVVCGRGDIVGDALVRADEVRAVSFTGSVTVGAHVAAVCAARNVRYQTEMGGKNVVIVMSDADLDLAARLTAAGAMRFAGQKCTATSRAIVMKRVADAFAEKLADAVAALQLGPVEDANAAVGPLIDEAARERVLGALADVGGQLACGGGVPKGAVYDRGFYVEPAIVRNADPDAPIAQEELFGPVVALMHADGLDEALELANRTRYGLSASLFTRDIGSALKYIHRIEAGLVRVNGDTTGVDPHAPFGGMKGSSSGSREQGVAAREFYTEYRTVQISG
ncbi:MAG TPA: aldehyde dehydrogenase family protein [Longimicrobiales bacterium]|nr:aldehyde dehydrogenase family protein [Longimicrobiales bacterium]